MFGTDDLVGRLIVVSRPTSVGLHDRPRLRYPRWVVYHAYASTEHTQTRLVLRVM